MHACMHYVMYVRSRLQLHKHMLGHVSMIPTFIDSSPDPTSCPRVCSGRAWLKAVGSFRYRAGRKDQPHKVPHSRHGKLTVHLDGQPPGPATLYCAKQPAGKLHQQSSQETTRAAFLFDELLQSALLRHAQRLHGRCIWLDCPLWQLGIKFLGEPRKRACRKKECLFKLNS